jgi:antitoxin (DNA-binding transcriptional repressor) of toxin-antitoxin stability system
VTEFKAKCLEIIREVQEENVSYSITKHDKIVAEVHPISTKNDNTNLLMGSVIFESDLISPTGEIWESDS